MSVPSERLEEALDTVQQFITQHGYEIKTMGDGERSAVPMPTGKALEAFDTLAAALREAQDENERLREAVENLYEDVDDLFEQDIRLHDLQQRVGAVFLGYGGGYNHVDDLRAALAPADEATP